MNTFFTSDYHYGHKNITGPLISSWDKGYRNFATTQEMNELLVSNTNDLIKEDDELYFLGDWSLGGRDNIEKFRNELRCKNIYFILGNHDPHIKKYSHLFRWVNKSVDMHINSQYFCLSHFSHRVWDRSHEGSIHLYGHSHGSIPDYGKSMDIGIDTMGYGHAQFTPYHFDEIISIMKNRPIEFPDHHNPLTNKQQ